jgi:hypothetical protein
VRRNTSPYNESRSSSPSPTVRDGFPLFGSPTFSLPKLALFCYTINTLRVIQTRNKIPLWVNHEKRPTKWENRKNLNFNSKNQKVKIYYYLIPPIFLYGIGL